MATNLGAVVLAIIAQKTADDIKRLYQTAFDADFYHSLHLISVIKNSISESAEKDDSDLVSKINEMSPQLYTLAKGYLETFEQHYYEKDNESESKIPTSLSFSITLATLLCPDRDRVDHSGLASRRK